MVKAFEGVKHGLTVAIGHASGTKAGAFDWDGAIPSELCLDCADDPHPELVERLKRSFGFVEKSIHDQLFNKIAEAAKGVCDSPAFLQRICDAWWEFEMRALRDRELGRQPNQMIYRDLLRAARQVAAVRKVLDENKVMLPDMYRGDAAERTEQLFESIDVVDMMVESDLASLERLEHVLNFPLSAGNKRKAFLPYVACMTARLHMEFGLSKPLLSNSSAAVKLMQAITSACHIEVSADAHRKALKRYVAAWFD